MVTNFPFLAKSILPMSVGNNLDALLKKGDIPIDYQKAVPLVFAKTQMPDFKESIPNEQEANAPYVMQPSQDIGFKERIESELGKFKPLIESDLSSSAKQPQGEGVKASDLASSVGGDLEVSYQTLPIKNNPFGYDFTPEGQTNILSGKKVGVVNKIGVGPEKQGKGFGRKILELAEKEMLDNGAEYSIIRQPLSNAIGFYERVGYKYSKSEDIAIKKLIPSTKGFSRSSYVTLSEDSKSFIRNANKRIKEIDEQLKSVPDDTTLKNERYLLSLNSAYLKKDLTSLKQAKEDLDVFYSKLSQPQGEGKVDIPKELPLSIITENGKTPMDFEKWSKKIPKRELAKEPNAPILVEYNDGKFTVLDGRHRLVEAYKRGDKTIPVEFHSATDFKALAKDYPKLSQPQGEGVRAYHGGRPISQFKKGETVWLSTSKDTAGVNVGDPAKWHHIKSLGGDPESVFPLERAIVNLKKPFIVDAKEAYYYHIKTPKELLKSGYTDLKTVDTDIIADWAKENGYDGIIIKNVVEGKGASNVGDSIAVFDSKNITLSQPQGEEQQLYDEIARQLGINGRSQ